MDIRNIKTEAPKPVDNYLQAIYDLQKDLMDGYIGKIEKDLPKYPVNIHTEKGQLVLKDFSARVIEETAEGYESTTEALKLAESVGFNITLLKDTQFNMLLNHLQNSNEEQADAFAFLVELMLYANIQPEDIRDYILAKWKDSNGNVEYTLNTNDLLTVLFDIGASLHYNAGVIVNVPHLYNLVNKEKLEYFNKDVDHVLSYIPGFRNTNDSLHRQEDNMLWKVVYHLNIGRNFLKNKTWKQTQELTDIVRYQEQVVLALIYYCGYLGIMGFEPSTFYTLFYKKHMVNKFRQKSKY